MMCMCECCTGIIPEFREETLKPGINPRFPVYLALIPGCREVWWPRSAMPTSAHGRADVAPTSLRRRADVAPTSLRHRADVAPTSLRRRFDIGPTSLRCRSDIGPTSLRCRSDIAPNCSVVARWNTVYV